MSSPIIKRYKNSDGTIDIWIKDATSLRYSTVLIGMSSSITDEAIASSGTGTIQERTNDSGKKKKS
jgi:hypothetical protein